MRYLLIVGVMCLALTGCVVQEGQPQQQPIIVNPPQQQGPIIVNPQRPGPCRPGIDIVIPIGGHCPGGCRPGCPHHHHHH